MSVERDDRWREGQGMVEIPYQILYRLVSRHNRREQMKSIGPRVPRSVMEHEAEMIDRALEDLRAFAVERGYVSRGDDVELERIEELDFDWED